MEQAAGRIERTATDQERLRAESCGDGYGPGTAVEGTPRLRESKAAGVELGSRAEGQAMGGQIGHKHVCVRGHDGIAERARASIVDINGIPIPRGSGCSR